MSQSLKKLYSMTLVFVDKRSGLKDGETDIIEFEALALVQCPLGTGQENSQLKCMRRNMITLPSSISSNLAFVISLCTSIPGGNCLNRVKCQKRGTSHWSAPKSTASPRLFAKNDFSRSAYIQQLVTQFQITW